MLKTLSSRAVRIYPRTKATGAISVIALLIFGLVFGLEFFWTMSARADEISDLMAEATIKTRDSAQPIAPDAVDVASCDAQRQSYEAGLPVPSPTPGVPPNIGYVVQFVNETNQTILGSSNAAQGNGGSGPAIPVLPREGTWVMGPINTTRADGSPANVLTIDIPAGWENSICGHGTMKEAGCVGPVFWARTGCRFDIAGNLAQCETGGCSSIYDCSKAAQSAPGPKALAEWTFRDDTPPPNGPLVAPDISVVDGVNLNMDIEPIGPGFPSASPQGQSGSTWLGTNSQTGQSNLPLTNCGQDLRSGSSCPIGQFQVKRHDLGMFIQNNPNDPDPNGNDVVACLSNCGFYEFLGGTFTGPNAPCPGFRCPGTPALDCDPTSDLNCANWRTFCCFTPAGDPTGIYTKACTDGNEVPSTQCTQHGICWTARTDNNHPVGTCSCAAFLANSAGTCPTNVCTNQNSEANGNQPPFNTCKNATLLQPVLPPGISPPRPSEQCIGDDTFHTVMPRGLTWPNDPQTYFTNATAYRVVFAPGYFVSHAARTAVPVTPSGPVPLCSSLPAQYGFATQYGGPNSFNHPCDRSVNLHGAQFAGAILGATANNTWSCDLIGPGIDPNRPNGAPPSNVQVLCRWH